MKFDITLIVIVVSYLSYLSGILAIQSRLYIFIAELLSLWFAGLMTHTHACSYSICLEWLMWSLHCRYFQLCMSDIQTFLCRNIAETFTLSTKIKDDLIRFITVWPRSKSPWYDDMDKILFSADCGPRDDLFCRQLNCPYGKRWDLSKCPHCSCSKYSTYYFISMANLNYSQVNKIDAVLWAGASIYAP